MRDLVIRGVTVPVDDDGMIRLNTLHKISGASDDQAPSEWRRRKAALDQIEELKKQSVNLRGEPVVSHIGGACPGTYAHPLLAISYAGWISPKFQLEVNSVFLDYKAGRLGLLEEDQSMFDIPLRARFEILAEMRRIFGTYVAARYMAVLKLPMIPEMEMVIAQGDLFRGHGHVQ